MVQNLQTLELFQFNGGLNLRDDEGKLPLTQTPDIQNIEISAIGLSKLKGWEEIQNTLPPNISIQGLFSYRFTNGEWKFIAISYPDILIIDPLRGDFSYAVDSNGDRYAGWVNTGKPFAVRVGDFLGLTDGANDPILLDQYIVNDVDWKPAYTDNNNAAGSTADDIGNLVNSYLATSANPDAADIGYPTISAYHKNRWWVNDSLNRRRLYVTKNNAFISGAVSGFTNIFSDNDPDTYNIAFFVDVPCKSDIVGLKVISDEALIVYCESEILILVGNHPPGTGYPDPKFDFNLLNDEVGAIDQRLIATKGDNDHYFVSNKKTVYQTSLTDNFIQVKPKGLSSKIYPAFENLKIDTFKRGFLANHRIKGELQLFLPAKDQRRYPTVCYTLNYSDSLDPNEPAWSRIGDFTSSTDIIKIRGISEIDLDNELYIAGEAEIYKANTGIAFGDNANLSKYQFATLDFGYPLNNKRILDVILYAYTDTGANLKFYHLWQDGQSGFTNVSLEANASSVYGSAIYGTSKYASKAGLPFKEKVFKLDKNRVGKQLKFRIEHDSASEYFEINKIVFRFQVLGQ